MGFFKRKNKGESSSKSEQQETFSGDSQSQWEKMAQDAEKERTERLNAERQQKKIIAALLLGNGGVDPSPFDPNKGPINISEDGRQAYLDKVVNREIGDDQYRELLGIVGDRRLDAPVAPGMDPFVVKAKRATDTFNSAYEWAILRGVMTGHTPSMEHGIAGSSSDIDNLANFYQHFKTPLDFEKASEAFLGKVRVEQGSEYANFQKKMESFKKKVYGKKQEYWDQIKALRDEATDFQLREQKYRERTGENGQN